MANLLPCVCGTPLLPSLPSCPHLPCSPRLPVLPELQVCEFQASVKSFLNLVTPSLAALELVLQPAWALLSLLEKEGRGGKRRVAPITCRDCVIPLEFALKNYLLPGAAAPCPHGGSERSPGRNPEQPPARVSLECPTLRAEIWDLGASLIWGFEGRAPGCRPCPRPLLGKRGEQPRVPPSCPSPTSHPFPGDCKAGSGCKSPTRAPVRSRSLSRTICRECRSLDWESQLGFPAEPSQKRFWKVSLFWSSFLE